MRKWLQHKTGSKHWRFQSREVWEIWKAARSKYIYILLGGVLGVGQQNEIKQLRARTPRQWARRKHKRSLSWGGLWLLTSSLWFSQYIYTIHHRQIILAQCLCIRVTYYRFKVTYCQLRPLLEKGNGVISLLAQLAYGGKETEHISLVFNDADT